MYKYECLHAGKPIYASEDVHLPKHKINTAHYFHVINDDEKSMLLDDNNVSGNKTDLFDRIDQFIKQGNGWPSRPTQEVIQEEYILLKN